MKQIVGALMVAAAGATSASAATLTLTLGGSFYEGAPAYEIIADGVVVASGTVANEQGDVVRFEVGDPKALAIRFTNDFAGPRDASGQRPPGTDRNLIIEAVDYKGQTTLGRELFRPRGVSRRGDFALVAVNQTVEIPIHIAAVVPASFQSLGPPRAGETILTMPAAKPVSFTTIAPPPIATP